jgi:hypothetical protein
MMPCCHFPRDEDVLIGIYWLKIWKRFSLCIGKISGITGLKRAMDIGAELLGIGLLGLTMLFIALLVRLNLGSPVLFRQVRPGHHGKPFVLYKFRTMSDERDENGNLLPDAARLTSLGRFLRSTSVDELACVVQCFERRYEHRGAKAASNAVPGSIYA